MSYDLNNYFMKPTSMSNGLLLYPARLSYYEDFIILANKYILLDIKSLNNKFKQEHQKLKKLGEIPKNEKYKKLQYDNLFDYLINLIITNYEQYVQILSIKKLSLDDYNKLKEELNNSDKSDNEKKFYNSLFNFYDIDEEKIINPIDEFKKFIGFVVNTNIENIEVYESKITIKLDKEYTLNKDNFYEFREIVMKQNLMYEPIIAPNIISQKYIDLDMKRKSGGNEFDLEALVAFVSVNSNYNDISDYTYYRLRADANMIQATMNYSIISNYNANGCTDKNGKQLPMPNLFEHLSIKDNPYKNTFKEQDIKMDKICH